MDTSVQEFKEGQVWSYRTRPNESGSTVLINKIDNLTQEERAFFRSRWQK